MSQERARRREARQAESARRAAEARARAERQVARSRRRIRRRRAVRTALPWLPGQRWNRRTQAQRGVIVAVLLAALVVVWIGTGSWPLRIAFLLIAVIVTPAVVTLFLDRSSR
ncbi:MAG TPA: hypothetical protein VFX70_01145 [Mycobacteriales bacterium]|nr:hypothetical protein [Mycobacteriales bacterium]